MIETNVIDNNMLAQPLSNSPNQVGLSNDDFLKLLITQLSHQDPLSPMESQDFASQLAQLSSLEKLQSIDSNIKQGIEIDLILTQAINNTLAATIIGRHVTALGDTVMFDADGSAEVSFRLDGFADKIEITITDSEGNTVREFSAQGLSEGDHTLSWDGKNQHGETVLEGTYHFSVKATDSSGNTISAITLIQGIISGIRYENGMAVLVVNDEEIPFSSVLEIGMEENI